MNCIKAHILMNAAVDGELSFMEEQRFQVHISECLECDEEFEHAKKNKMIIKERIYRFKAPRSLVNSIMQLSCTSKQESVR
jgi:anti-sigma factor RsiW